MNTVESNKSYFRQLKIKVTYKSIMLQQLVEWPSAQTLKEVVRKNLIINWPITIDNIDRAEAIYIPQIPIIKGKAIITRPEYHKTIPRIPLPDPISKHYHNVEISMDIFFVNVSLFLHTQSRNIYFKLVQSYVARWTMEPMNIITTSAQNVDTVLLTQGWYKPPWGAIQGYSN